MKLKEMQLIEKEQQLILKENSLALREEQLLKREILFDSTSGKFLPDTLSTLYPNLSGTWNVVMRCTETTCQGSAVGDTKTEQWEISVQNNTVISKAMTDNKIIRVYTGSQIGTSLELTAQQEPVAGAEAAKMIVRLQPTKENEMTGQREILRPNECRIVYALELRKP